MRDRLHVDPGARREPPPCDAPSPQTPPGRFDPCEICGQSFDRIDPVLAAYHSGAEHKPLPE